MTADADSTVPRLTLWRRLERARIESGSSQSQVAEALGWALPDFLLVEAVVDGLDDGRLPALLDYHGIAGEVRDLYQAVQALSRRGVSLSREIRLVVEYERVASTIRTFEPFFIPGLLQTRAYAEAALKLFASPADVGPLVEARLARQEIFGREDVPDMVFLIDESTLQRWTGAGREGSDVMRGQLDHLRQVARNPHVRIQVVPFAAGLHAGMKGPFVILEFADREQSDLLYLENAEGDTVHAGSADVRAHLERFRNLSDSAAPTEDLYGFLDRALENLNAGRGS